MAIKSFKPYTPSRRNMTVSAFDGVDKKAKPERSLVEIRGVDINKLKETQEIVDILGDIPDYCTVVFICSSGFEPDKRLKLYKSFTKYGAEICVTAQTGDQLIKWIIKRFAAEGKGIELNAAQRLISVSGGLMNRLIPEIGKVASYAKGKRVKITLRQLPVAEIVPLVCYA